MNRQLDKHLKYCNDAIDLKNRLETDFLVLGELLYEIREKSLWEPNWQSWEEFSWELKMSANTINKLIQIYKTLILGYGFTKEQIANAGGWTLVAEVLPRIASKKDALKWLHNAQTLTRADLRKTIKEEKTGVSMTTCTHQTTRLVEICTGCGESWALHEGEHRHGKDK